MVSVGSGSPDEDPPVDSPLYPELEGYLPASDPTAAMPTPGLFPGVPEPGTAGPGWIGPGPVGAGTGGPGSAGPGSAGPGSSGPGSSGPGGVVPPASIGPGGVGPGSPLVGPGGYVAGRGQVPPARTHEAFKPYVAPRVTRRRRSDWPILVFALIVATLVMAACCIAGFAVYVNRGGTFG